MSFFSRMYQKVIISIDLDMKTCRLRITYHNNKHMKQEERSYKTINADFPIEAAKYIRRIKNKYPFTYIGTMSRSANQGLINGNKIDIFNKFGLDINALTIMLINKKWFVYISKESIQNYKNKFNKVNGVDFIFSPFIIIYEKIKNRLEEAKKLYILQEKTSTSLLVADKDGIYFGNYIIFEEDNFVDEIKENDTKQNDTIEFDAIDDIDENIIIKDFDKTNYEISSTGGLSELSIANHMIEIIKETLNNFYKDDRYASDFIDELLILDGYGINDNALIHLKNNTMMETHFLRIDICEEIEKLVKLELKL
ncbi:hypothetical protein CCY99_02085 [Helicobacter sp. 16-1353]|uniref:hypothetical protein n=1 Tax=Helicobacter sp. 16-1353 TaxID=2004996 RepID=UPI000DCF3E9A|nr:hypothetical protein [Helicobacter sp. 16-1353]RAX54954.1 hypothetical protein CCY99_02085 [Helicobacter sp. 16-1353]